jgi:hypothetical protein
MAIAGNNYYRHPKYIIDGSAKAEAKINDGFGFSIWISTHSLGDRDGR